MNIQEFYKGILESIGLTVDEKGGCYLTVLDQPEPFYVSGKHLVLPTPEVLRVPDWDNQIAFHPLSENIARKNSVVFNELQRLVNLSTNVDIGNILYHMVSLCADKDRHATLNHRQTAFLQLFPDADETSVKNFDKIESKNSSDNAYVKLVTTRDGKLNGQQYPRVTKVRFPFYEEILEQSKTKSKEYTLFGVKVRKKDFNGYKALFEYLIKHAATPDEHYSYGSRNHLAPSFHALMSATNNVKQDIRKMYLLLKLDTPEINWGAQLDNLQQYKGHIPPLDGNEGELTEGDRRKQAVTTPVPTQPAVVQPQPVAAAPVVQPVPQVPVVQPQAYPTAHTPNQVLPAPQAVQAVQPVNQVLPAPTNAPKVVPAAQPGTTTSSGLKVIPFKSPFAPQMPVAQYQQPTYAPAAVPATAPVPAAQPQVQYQQPATPLDPYGRPLYRQPYQTVQPMMQQPMMGYGQPMMMQPQMGYQQSMMGYNGVPAGWGSQPQYQQAAIPGWR